MVIQKIIYGKSFEMAGYWEKISLEMAVQEGEKAEKVLDEAKYIVDTWHKENPQTVYKNKSNVVATPVQPIINIQDVERLDKEWNELVDKLKTFPNQSSAQEYLSTTDYKHTIAAKEIINQLPL